MRDDALTDRTLHLVNGACTTRLLQAAGIPGRTTEWADVLYEGPVPRLSDEALAVVRARHLTPPSGSVKATVAGFRAWRAAIDDVAAYDELVLWYEHDLFDQLNLVQVLVWLGDRHRPRRISLVSLDRFPGRPTFKGLGELTPADIASLAPQRAAITGAQFDLAAAAWDALRAPTPEDLDRLRQGDTAPLPFLAAALSRFLEEYPWTRDGLTRSERRLLQLAAAAPAPMPLATLFPRLHDGESSYHVTDRTLLAMIERLASGATPLLDVDGNAAGGLDRRVTITGQGREVLAGRLDGVSACGLDVWRGGVHLRARDHWRWDDQSHRVVRGWPGRTR